MRVCIHCIFTSHCHEWSNIIFWFWDFFPSRSQFSISCFSSLFFSSSFFLVLLHSTVGRQSGILHFVCQTHVYPHMVEAYVCINVELTAWRMNSNKNICKITNSPQTMYYDYDKHWMMIFCFFSFLYSLHIMFIIHFE